MDINFFDTDGAVRMMPRRDPWAELRALDRVFPDPLPAYEDMLGDIHGDPRNAGGGAGPSLMQVMLEDDIDYYVDGSSHT